MPFPSPTIALRDSRGFNYVAVSPEWAQLCHSLPCFAALHWPDYETRVRNVSLNGQPRIIQLWKGWCPQFLGLTNMPGGVGAEVGIYRKIPGKARPNAAALAFLPQPFRSTFLTMMSRLSDDQLWWPVDESHRLEFTLINPFGNRNSLFFDSTPTNGYWNAQWMQVADYSRYQQTQGKRWSWLPAWFPRNSRTPNFASEYRMKFKVNGVQQPDW